MAASVCLSFYSKIYSNVSIYKVYLSFTVIIFSKNEDAPTKEAARGSFWRCLRDCVLTQESRGGFTHHTLINQNEAKAWGRCCMEYSAINVIKCRIYGEVDAYDIYIADDRSAIFLCFINIITIFFFSHNALIHRNLVSESLFIWNPSM